MIRPRFVHRRLPPPLGPTPLWQKVVFGLLAMVLLAAFVVLTLAALEIFP